MGAHKGVGLGDPEGHKGDSAGEHQLQQQPVDADAVTRARTVDADGGGPGDEQGDGGIERDLDGGPDAEKGNDKDQEAQDDQQQRH